MNRTHNRDYRCKPIGIYMQGKLIHTADSVTEAGEYVGLAVSTISNLIKRGGEGKGCSFKYAANVKIKEEVEDEFVADTNPIRITQTLVIMNLLTGHYFRTYKEVGTKEIKASWTKGISFANHYNAIGSVNYDIKKHKKMFNEVYYEIKKVNYLQIKMNSNEKFN